MLKLTPILEHMGACNESLTWLREKNFATFEQAFSACPDGCWIDWLVEGLICENNQASALCSRACGSSDELLKFYASHCEDIERWLVEYAHKHGCAVEVRRDAA